MSKQFTTVKLEQVKESESDLSGSDGEEASHFQCDAFQFTQLESEFEPRISNLFKQAHGDSVALDLKQTCCWTASLQWIVLQQRSCGQDSQEC
jgi:hypothetical protein